MEEQEKDTIFFMALAVSGAVLASGLAAFLQWIVVLPLTLAVFFVMILTIMQYRKGAFHLSVKLENWAMIAVLIAFICSFIYLYRPV
jgi:energy-converting hydrogenase A subunit K